MNLQENDDTIALLREANSYISDAIAKIRDGVLTPAMDDLGQAIEAVKNALEIVSFSVEQEENNNGA